jgi:hypothetical protein
LFWTWFAALKRLGYFQCSLREIGMSRCRYFEPMLSCRLVPAGGDARRSIDDLVKSRSISLGIWEPILGVRGFQTRCFTICTKWNGFLTRWLVMDSVMPVGANPWRV